MLRVSAGHGWRGMPTEKRCVSGGNLNRGVQRLRGADPDEGCQ